MDYKLEKFEEKLCTELTESPKLVTEDLIRHWYIKTVGKDDARIEVPYCELTKKSETAKLYTSTRSRVDLLLKKRNCAIEFKYHRKNKPGQSCTTDNLAYVIKDMSRLSLLDIEHKVVLYVFDKEMHAYVNKHCNQLLQKDASVELSSLKKLNLTNYFWNKAFESFADDAKDKLNYTIKIIEGVSFNNGFYTYAYEIV